MASQRPKPGVTAGQGACQARSAAIPWCHSQEMPARKGILASKNDEVGQLSTALHSYKSHLVEMESIREEQANRRHERDEVIIEKMTALADQLDGNARTLILNDIKKMNELAESSDRNSSEEASVELMLVAF